MKRCPECRRDYYDDTLLYCLDDGNALLEGPGSGAAALDEPATAILPGGNFGLATTLAANRNAAINSIAVLPFTNISADAEYEYFCDGLSEELLNALTKIEELKVAARASAFSFKGKSVAIAEIARKLGVNTILEGSVRKSAGRVRISVQLVNASDGYHIWSERYDREMADIFDIQDEITLAVVDALKLKLFGVAKSDVLKKGTASTEAHELYLRGRFFWNRRSVDDFGKATDQFRKAIEADPGYALAYSGLADCLIFLGYYEVCQPAKAAPGARAAVNKALAVDSRIAESQASMALYMMYYEFDWKGGEERLLRAIELNPNLPTARYWYCSLLNALGRFDESYQQGCIALELDPLNPIVSGSIARGFCHAGRFDDAIQLSVKALDLAPDFFFTHLVLGLAYLGKNRIDDAIRHLRTAADTSDMLVVSSFLGFALARTGRTEEARKILGDFAEEARHKYVSPLCFCAVYAGLGEIDNALDWLERAWEDRSIPLMWLKTESIFNDLRSESRFQRVYEKTGLP